MNQHNITIVIPTYDRPELLQRTLAFIRESTDIPIIVADGSSGSLSEQNLKVCKGVGTQIEYFCFPVEEDKIGKTNNYRARLFEAVSKVKTPYVAMCADDDLIICDLAQQCADFLNNNPDYIACHGSYVGFRSSADGYDINSIVYDGASIDSSEIPGRLLQLYSNYEASFYAV